MKRYDLKNLIYRAQGDSHMMITSAFRTKTKTLLAAGGILAVAALAFVLYPARAYAAVSQTQATAQVSFTFDDGLLSSLTEAAPALQQYGFTGTNYVTTGCIGTVGTCQADEGATYMTWEQVTQLKNLGWEIGGHSDTHPEMTTISAAQLEQEVAQSKATLEAHGIQAKAFATPYGDYNGNVEAAIAKYYTSHRGFHDTGYNSWPYNSYLLRVQQVQAGVSVETVKGYVDAAKANNQWLILVFHDIQDSASTDPDDYEYATADLAAIAAYVKQQNVKVTNISDGLVTGTDNQMPGGGFDNGISDGWSTDAPANVTPNAGGNGSTPGATNSVAMNAGANNVHLFSPKVTVDPSKKYWISTYANIKQRNSGEVGVYVDEYDGNGVWISGQYLAALTSDQIKNFSLIYQTSTSAVKSIRIQYIVTANSGILVYIDNAQVFIVEAAGPAPNPNPTVVNLMPNSQFDNGIGDGWSTDNPVAFQADTNNNGSTSGATKSIKLAAAATNAHLFAPKVTVEADKTYTVKAFINVLTLTSGELGFYIDEYDSNGNWISGKYIPGKRTVGSEEVTFEYTPSSANVASASLQFILVANSGITGYLDDVRWLSTTTTPTPPTPAPNPNLLSNGSFQNGVSNGWTTDAPTEVTADSTNKGDTSEEAVNSVKMVANATKNVHLFSPKVTVDPAKTYTLQAHLDIVAIAAGEVAFYIDEYDSNGNWISGKYLTSRNTTGGATANIAYTPTSANVASANLQVIVTAGSGITAYVDNVRWTVATA